MDGRQSTDPDPQHVLEQLLAQAQAGSTSLPLPPLRAPSDDSTDGDGSGSEEDVLVQPFGYEQLSSTLSTITADRCELSDLLTQKRLLKTALKRNTRHQLSLTRSLSHLHSLRSSLKSTLLSLDTADIVDAEDASLEVIRYNASSEDAAAKCPFPARMVQQIPLLRLQSIERAEYDNALNSRVWLESEDHHLRIGVRAVVLKVFTVEKSREPGFKGDAIAEAAGLGEEEVWRLAEEIENRGGLDWRTVAARLPNRSIEEVRTRWNGYLRPSVNTRAWTKEEVEQLVSLVTPHLASHLTQTQAGSSSTSASAPPVPWLRIAKELGTNRTPYACFTTFCSTIVNRDQPDFTPAEDERIKELFSLFRGSWRLIALHSSVSAPNLSLTASKSDPRPASLLGKVGRESQNIYRRFRNTIDPALKTGKFSAAEDALLINSIREVGEDNWTAIAARISGRTSSQCRERWVRRLKQVFEAAGEVEGVDEEEVEWLVKGRRKVKWTQGMDEVLRRYVDGASEASVGEEEGERKGKGKGKNLSFAEIARRVGKETGVSLSDKNVRDRLISYRRERERAERKDGKDKRQAESEEGQEIDELAGGDIDMQAEPASATAVEEQPPDDPPSLQPKDGIRPRTTITPGSKRRKL